MKSFLIWFALFVVLFGGLSTGTHLLMSADPTRIAIAFDDSYYMKDAWAKIPGRLQTLEGRKYTEFFILSNKEKISRAWEKELNTSFFIQTRLFLDEFPLADLVNSRKYPELDAADKIYVLTPQEVGAEIKNRGKVTIVKL